MANKVIPTTFDEASACGIPFEIAGRKFQLTPLGPIDFNLAKQQVKEKTRNPLDVIAEQLPKFTPDVQRALAEKAYEDFRKWGSLESDEGRQWITSMEGLAFLFWRSVIRNHPETKLEELQAILNKVLEEGLQTVINDLDSKIFSLNENDTNPQKPGSSKNFSATLKELAQRRRKREMRRRKR